MITLNEMRKTVFLIAVITLLASACSLRHEGTYAVQPDKSVVWSALWIGGSSPEDVLTGYTVLPARYLRKEARIKDGVTSARFHICGLGSYKAWINGEDITFDQELSPTLSDYDKRVYFNSFDVTSLIRKGRNSIAVSLGNGRFQSMRVPKKGVKFGIPALKDYGVPRLLCQLEVTYKDGSREVIGSDGSWKVTTEGPIRANSEFDGETYDCRMELGAWTEPGYKEDGRWSAAMILEAPKGHLEPQPNPNIAIQDIIKPVAIKKVGDAYVVDMGQNMVGWLRVKASGLAKGDSLHMRFAETNLPDGSIYLDNLRGARVHDVVVSAGKPIDWHPAFVYHGFRFVEVKGLGREPKLSDFEGQVLYDKMAVTGTFECSNRVINTVYHNAFHGIRSNYRGIPTDCPQRDERQGWLGDRTMNCYGESYMFGNRALYSKWLQDIADAQTPAGSIPDVVPPYWAFYSDNMTWPGAFITVADMLYERYGDVESVVKHYPAMKKWLSYMKDRYGKGGLITKDRYGDHCMPPESLELIHSRDKSRITSGVLISSSFYYYLCGIMEKFALLAGHPEDVSFYEAERAITKDAYNKEFFNEKKGNYSNNTLTANMLSLYFGLVPEGREQDVFSHVVDISVAGGPHINCGLVGVMVLMRTLTEYGRPDLAYAVASSEEYPSWGYMATQGATTIWELWNGNTAAPDMNSMNHVMMIGDFLIWTYEYLGGIRPAAPAYKEIELMPYTPSGLDWVNCSYDSVAGRITSNWKRTGNAFEWDVEIPQGTSATAYVPTAGGRRIEKLAPGRHHLTSTLK